ncbi:MAG: hypothetical protein KDA44_11385 [Planctomycetales bacterium]|nr:hypothetical protein [Planctomycetales bacterium]
MPLLRICLALVVATAALGCQPHGPFVKRESELNCPTDIRKTVPWCFGEDAIFTCPCGPDEAYNGMKPTCWRAWPGGGAQWRDTYCAGGQCPGGRCSSGQCSSGQCPGGCPCGVEPEILYPGERVDSIFGAPPLLLPEPAQGASPAPAAAPPAAKANRGDKPATGVEFLPPSAQHRSRDEFESLAYVESDESASEVVTPVEHTQDEDGSADVVTADLDEDVVEPQSPEPSSEPTQRSEPAARGAAAPRRLAPIVRRPVAPAPWGYVR